MSSGEASSSPSSLTGVTQALRNCVTFRLVIGLEPCSDSRRTFCPQISQSASSPLACGSACASGPATPGEDEEEALGEPPLWPHAASNEANASAAVHRMITSRSFRETDA